MRTWRGLSRPFLLILASQAVCTKRRNSGGSAHHCCCKTQSVKKQSVSKTKRSFPRVQDALPVWLVIYVTSSKLMLRHSGQLKNICSSFVTSLSIHPSIHPPPRFSRIIHLEKCQSGVFTTNSNVHQKSVANL